ncbi:MAG: hypothetical protein ACRDQB_03215 [Thermocrispum sp.]
MLTRLLDVVSLVESDVRVQVVFTYDPVARATSGARLAEYVAALDAAVVRWDQATATRFDLIIAASENDRLADLTGPIVLAPHGLGFQKLYPDVNTIAGMSAERLLHNGRVLPSAIAVSHPEQRRSRSHRTTRRDPVSVTPTPRRSSPPPPWRPPPRPAAALPSRSSTARC